MIQFKFVLTGQIFKIKKILSFLSNMDLLSSHKKNSKKLNFEFKLFLISFFTHLFI